MGLVWLVTQASNPTNLRTQYIKNVLISLTKYTDKLLRSVYIG